MPKKFEFNKEEVIRLYNKYRTMHRTSMSLGCTPQTLKRFLLENDIPIIPYDVNKIKKSLDYRWAATR